MTSRVLIAVAIALSARAGAQPVRPLWHGMVHSSRAGLPAVSIELGYPGPYVPAINTPLVLHAVANDVPFDGYIGFHFGVRGRQTLDTPVVSRASLHPHQAWTFTTIATVRKWGAPLENGALPREIVTEWRDRSMQLLATESAGVPPWTTFSQELLPLCIECSRAFGADAYRERAAALPDFAQWYAGFSSVVVALPVWLELPQRVREAIFGSGIYVVFIGAPVAGQPLDAITRALLPVTFAAQPGAYAAPWPYRNEAAVASPVSWSVKQGAGAAGVANKLPYIARSQTAAWMADEGALVRPLPSLVPIAGRRYFWHFGPATTRSSPAPKYLPAIAAVTALVLGVLAWLMIRKNRYRIAAGLLVAIVAAVAIGRNRLRPPANGFEYVVRGSIAPGVAFTLRDIWQYGPAPLAGPNADRASLTGDYGLGRNDEIRTSRTSPSMGTLHREQDWDAAIRWTFRRELAGTNAPANLIAPELRELHGVHMTSWFPATAGHYQVEGDLQTLDKDRMSCAFALPPNASAATLEVTTPLTGVPVEVTWATGSMRLQARQKDPYTAARCVIPSEVLRAANAAGGMIAVTVTLTQPVVQPIYHVTLEVQEKKS